MESRVRHGTFGRHGDGGNAVVPDVFTASKRLTWNWVVKSCLNRIPDYDVGNASAGDGWEADGCRFKYGGKFAKLASDPKIDWKVTIQVVCEAEKSGKTSSFTYTEDLGKVRITWASAPDGLMIIVR